MLQSHEVLVDPPEKILSLGEVFVGFHGDKQHWIIEVRADGIVEEIVTHIEDAEIPKQQITQCWLAKEARVICLGFAT